MEGTVDIQEKFRVYLQMQKELADFRKKQAEQKKLLQGLEEEIKEYMKKNGLDSLSLSDGQIVLYDRKVSQTFKRPVVIEKICEKLKCNEKKAEELAESIFSNKVFTVEQKLKANIKKK
jgi:hypothetical protein